MTFRLLFGILPLTLWAQSPETPAGSVRTFYSDYQKLHFSGLPDAAAVQKLKVYWSPALVAAITRAQGIQARCIKSHPDEKGPWVEGDMFTSNFEGFTSLRVEEPKPGNGARQNLPVAFEYVENGQKFPWTDQVEVIKQGNRWVIDNILYRRQSGFGNGFGSSLRQSLKGKGC